MLCLESSFLWLSGREPACQFRESKRHRFNPWVWKIPWSRKWQPTPIFLPGKFHGQRSLVGYSPWGPKESDATEQECTSFLWLSGREPACQFRESKRHRFNPWVWKIPWRRKWQPTPVILPRKSHGQRNLAGYSPWGHNTTEQLNNDFT